MGAVVAHRLAAPPAHQYDEIVARDRFGVPHIFGKTDAECRLRHRLCACRGRFLDAPGSPRDDPRRASARSTGQDGAKSDYVLHLLGAREHRDARVLKQPADVPRAARCLCRRPQPLCRRRTRSEIKLARLFPVSGEDVATGFVAALALLLRARVGVLGVARRRQAAAAREAPARAPECPPTSRRSAPKRHETGSNAFVVAPKRSADGFTRLVSNSHQPWRGGVAWYELVVRSQQRLEFRRRDLSRRALSVARAQRDARLDQHRQPPRPDRRLQARPRSRRATDISYDGQWRPLEEEARLAAGQALGPFVLPVPKTVYRAVQGPVIANKAGGSFASASRSALAASTRSRRASTAIAS